MSTLDRQHLDWLLHADPFVPFTIFMGSRHELRIQHPSTVTWRGGVPIVEDGSGFTLVNLEQVVFIYVDGALPNERRVD
jgi:hypothetical protein